ncbi:MAG: 6-carboxytetrahydropterin synthase [Gemmatimonadaceae bacterium]
MYTVTVRTHMMIAHSLPDPFFGPAAKMHGATYVVDLEFSSKTLNPQNVVIDIGAADEAARRVVGALNYQNLDELEIFKGKLTTTEFLAKHIHDAMRARLAGHFSGDLKVTLNESHVASAGYASEA